MKLGTLICLPAVLVVCGVVAQPNAPPSRLRNQTINFILGATQVETYRIEGFGPKPAPGQRVIDGYPVLSRGRTQGAGFAHRLAAVLTNPQTFAGAEDRCIFDPGVVFRLRNGSDAVDALICYHCNDIMVITNRARDKAVYGRSYLVRPQLVRLTKEAFPGDKEIQMLKEKPGP